MKKLLTLLLVLLAAACASPYQPVYVSGEGDYYIAETGVASGYYYGGAGDFWGAGMYPWWSTAYYYGYPPSMFYYYSPYFYPHRFNVWYSGWYPHGYGWGGWHPPMRRAHPGRPIDGSGTGGVADRPPAPPGGSHTVSAPAYPVPAKYINRKPYRQLPSEGIVAPRHSASRSGSMAVPSYSVRPDSSAVHRAPRPAYSSRPARSNSRAARPSPSSQQVSRPAADRPSASEEH
jgi:hypothetical protein